jgi:hypothetical protein
MRNANRTAIARSAVNAGLAIALDKPRLNKRIYHQSNKREKYEKLANYRTPCNSDNRNRIDERMHKSGVHEHSTSDRKSNIYDVTDSNQNLHSNANTISNPGTKNRIILR